MKTAVCVKRVPDSEAAVRPAADGRSVDKTGIKFVLNPYDEYAVEEALAIRDREGGEVVAVTLGPAAAAETLRTVLAMGADRAVLLETDSEPVDPLSVAKTLASELAAGSFEMLLFGKLAIDDGAQAVGQMVATLLGLPCVCAVTRLELEGARGRAEREVEGGTEVVEFTLPAVLTADKGLNQPRRAGLRQIMTAKQKPLETKPVEPDAGGLEVVECGSPRTQRAGRIVGQGAGAVPALVEVLRREAKVL